ncbi:cell division protein FtsZ [Panacagrimonas perspica]|uniref:Cell division protein FtsZ n=1 Tax=Panacagrimonas perspica TaxID=381431 RepID=A0A4R7NZ64_9GAMM|nr:cell division protein FtsZ [Panacagrimonas perspica]TDU26428.1 cell division protein FtsZ [Panacagrimonas perspica]
MNTRTNEMYEIVDGQPMDAVIRVIGVGGGGCNSVNEMVMAEIEGVELIAANTDRRHLEKCKTTNILQLGPRSSRGLGAGSDPARGREAAMESKDLIREMIEGTDLLFITAGMGGGTGTGAAPVIAEIAKELGILTVAVVTKPYAFEPVKRRHVADRGLQELRNLVDSLIVIPNEKLQLVLPEDMTVVECHKKADEVLKNAVQGISGIITSPGEISVDFADVRTVMSNRGMAMMGIGIGNGENRAIAAVEAALSCPLIDDIELHDAKGILVTLTHNGSLKKKELTLVMERVNEIGNADVDMKFGISIDESLGEDLRVTVVATGLGSKHVASVEKTIQPAQKVVSINSPRLEPVIPPLIVPTKIDYEKPAFERQQKKAASGGNAPAWLSSLDESVLNIPTFLRQQAD